MSREIQYVKGEFRKYKAMMKFSVGVMSGYLDKDDIIEYDGYVLRHNDKDYETDSLRGAIYAGWLTPVEEESDFEYKAKPADIQIHDANPRGEDRGDGRRIYAVADEERDVGGYDAVRAAARNPENKGATDLSPAAPTGAMTVDENLSPVPRKATRADTEGSQGRTVGSIQSARGMEVAGEEASSEGRAIGKVGVPAKQATDLSKTTGQEARRLDTTPRRRMDVPVGKAADSAQELLGSEAAVAGDTEGIRGLEAKTSTPEGIRGLEATVSNGDTGIRGLEAKVTGQGERAVSVEEDGQVIGSFKDAHTRPVGPSDERVEEIVASTVETEVETDVPPELIIRAKIEVIRQFVPGFEWDMSLHWRTRVKKALEYKDSMAVLNAILAMETEAVRKFVLQGLYGGE